MALMDQVMADMGKKLGMDLTKLEKPTLENGSMKLVITEAQLVEIMNSKGGNGNILPRILEGKIVIEIKIV
jgi:hypothetical protein